MKVLHVIASMDDRTGGPALALRGLALAQAKLGLEVTIASGWESDHGEPDLSEFKAANIRVNLIGPLRGVLKTTADLKDTITRLVADHGIIHIHGVWEDLQYRAMKAARRFRIPYVVRPCGMLDPWSLSQGSIKKKVYFLLRLQGNLRYASALHATSMVEARGIGSLLSVRQILVEPNGLELSDFSGPVQPLESPPTIVYLGRLHEKKKPEFLIESFARLPGSNTRLIIAGDGVATYRTKLVQLVADLGLEERVEFPGHVSGREKLQILQGASLFVLPSQQENFGVSVIEALACGTPVLLSDQVALAEEVTREGVGLALPLDSPDWCRVLEEKSIRGNWPADISERCRNFVAKRYSWGEIAGRWATHYERLLSP
ncbi:MAG: glycosyltransferase [Candidatus Sumerlaeia bacterium]|nr:glycosyltransferase [Candidatus Sumerlaeia bacterium]